MAQTSGCEAFQVGSRQWTNCIHDQATGGGLMPWIVVIPLGVMVVGMMIGFARQFSSAGQRKARAHGASGTAGTWLIFVSFVELAIGIGSLVAERKAPGEGGGFSIAATVLLGVGILLFVIGVGLKVKGFRRARIYHGGVPGEAVIRAVHQTGTMVNNQPMYAFDLDVTGQGFAPVSTRHREVVPFWFLNRVGPQARVPVKVDASNPTRLIFDWDAFAATSPAAATSAPAAPAFGGTGAVGAASAGAPTPVAEVSTADSLANAMQFAREFTDRAGSGWRVGKVIGLAVTLFTLAVVGGGLFFIARVFGEVSDVTSEVTDQISDAVEGVGGAIGGGEAAAGGSTIEVSRAAAGGAPVSYTLTLPVGWLDLTAAVQEDQGTLLVDVVTKPQTPSNARIVVTRSARYLRDPAPERADVTSVRRGIEREFGDALAHSRLVRLAGERALELDIAPGADGLRSRQVAVMRGGQVLFVGLTASEAEWRSMLEVFDGLLASWKWGAVSA